jgi:hypothetical protein
MSVWTHVAATARIDWLYPIFEEELDFEKLFGKTCRYDSPHEVWQDWDAHPESYLPGGSEGTLEMNVWTSPDPCMAARYTVTIFGDLRDYDDADGIVQWFREIIERKDIGVRQAVITAETEFDDIVSWTYKDKEMRWKFVSWGDTDEV